MSCIHRIVLNCVVNVHVYNAVLPGVHMHMYKMYIYMYVYIHVALFVYWHMYMQ